MINVIAGQILMGISLVFMAIGIYSVLTFHDFYSRVVITAKVDTVGFITLIFGAMLIQGFSFFSLKLLLILVFELLTSPISTHSIAHSAYTSGYTIRKEVRAEGSGE
ncbi:MAG: cation:proton antiporter [Spirochaetaceae bacterium]|nr:MAG: cation:proton antiporter [Spirochaetaceae bacterium]